MSSAVIGVLNACAETPGMPPCAFSGSNAADSIELGDSIDLQPLGAAELEVAGGEIAEDLLPPPDDPIVAEEPPPSRNPDLWLYRERTIALLRRYMRLSIEVGRMPSLLGRELFRSRVTSYGASTFEESVIFVHDVERSLEELNEFEKKLIAKIVLQQFSKEEAGRILGCGYRTVERLFPEALDRSAKFFCKEGF